MRLVTFTHRGTTRAGVMLDDDRVVDLGRGAAMAGGHLPSEIRALLEAGVPALDAARETLAWVGDRAAGDAGAALRAAGVIFDVDDPGFRFEAPVPNPGKVLAIGLNYRAHAAETGAPLPPHPIVFAKVDTTWNRHGGPIWAPRVSEQVDWEGELCFVIGRTARHVAAEHALDYVAGYMNGNDVSVRDYQAHAATWTMGKGFTTHAPMGPYLVTSDVIPDPAALELRTWVNGDLKQESSTGDLIFDIPALIEYLSRALTLRPGDVVFTGTPSGVGQARTPPEWLRPGDSVRVAITGLGELVNPVVAEPDLPG